MYLYSHTYIPVRVSLYGCVCECVCECVCVRESLDTSQVFE